jgi:putative heme iron utilization protein
MASSRQHAAPPAPERAPVPEPTLAERGRTLIQFGHIGTLSTHSRKQPGFPFGSVMPYAPDEQGRPVFLISNMAMHTQNLKADARASLLVMQEGGEDPLGAARITLVGEVVPVPEAETDAVRGLYLGRHQSARYWVDFDDFGFYRMPPADVYFIGGFGVMGWVSADEYAGSQPDPLAGHAAGILRHMNTDHAGALVLLARAAGETGAEEATMAAEDRQGFHLRLRSGDRVHGARIAFLREVRDPEGVRAVLVEMVRAARIRDDGVLLP